METRVMLTDSILSRRASGHRPGFRVISAVLFCLLLPAVFAAEKPRSDEMYERARQLAFSGKREEARDVCQQILSGNPDNVDARILLGRLYAWDRRYDEARQHLLRAVEKKPGYVDGRTALIDVELWSDHPAAALRYCDEGLAREPGHPALLSRRARALADLGRHEEALEAARRARDAAPDSEEVSRLVKRLEPLALRNKVTAEVSYDWFKGDLDPWRELSVELQHKFNFGTVIGRINQAERFGSVGTQYEVDAYPKLGHGMYLYLNVGYSGESFFPRRRHGAELYSKLPRKFEISGGYRRLEFSSSDVTLLTGSIGKYYGNYFIWFRPYYSNKEVGDSFSSSLYVRRYFGDPEDYVTFMVGGGATDDEDLTTSEILRLDTRRARVDAQRRLGSKWIIKGAVGYRFEEYPGFDRERWTFTAGFERLF